MVDCVLGSDGKPLTRFILQDSWYDQYKGAVNLVQVIDGSLKINSSVTSVKTGKNYSVKTLGLVTPYEIPAKSLSPGQVGIMTCNMRSTNEV